MTIIDRITPGEVLGTAEALLASVAHPDAPYLMALIDHSLKPDLDLLKRWPGPLPAIFNLTGHLSSDDTIAPLLLALPPRAQERPAVVAYLLRQCNGSPMFSLLSSKLPPDLLAEHLSTLTRVLLPPDGEAYVLRFADTRIAPALHRHLDHDQHEQIFGPFAQWGYLNREGKPATLPCGGRVGLPPEGPIKLTQTQFDALLRESRPDNFLPLLRENSPLFAQARPSQQYRQTSDWIARATAEAGEELDNAAYLSYCLSCL